MKKLVSYFAVFLLILVILKLLFGKHSDTKTIITRSPERRKGLPTSAYTANEKLSDFSIPKEVYNFKVPTPIPDLSKLREPVSMDLNKGLLIPSVQGLSVQSRSKEMERMPSSKGSSASCSDVEEVPQGEGIEEEQSVAADSSGTSQPATSIPKPNWELARKLFVGR